MEKLEFVKEQYQALRSEIDLIKNRLFKIVCLGLVVVPVLTYLAELPDTRFVGPLVPFVILMLVIQFLAEEHALMRCGRYIRERIEPLIEQGAGWEAWLESQPGLRTMDKCLFGCFVITLFVFYVLSAGMAIEKLWTSDAGGMSGEYKAVAGIIVYGIGAIWMIIILLHHWRSCTATSV